MPALHEMFTSERPAVKRLPAAPIGVDRNRSTSALNT